jgi:chloramphenicol 3-O phosphotransferase
MNLGVDGWIEQVTPPRLRPGIGLRPGGGERLDIEALLPTLYSAFFESVAAHSREGLNVVCDLGLHDAYAVPLGVLAGAAARLAGLPVLFVGVRCPIGTMMARRNAGEPGREGRYLSGSIDDPPAAVRRWQEAVHAPGVYDLEVDTSVLSAQACAAAIAERLLQAPRPTALWRSAALQS